MGVTLPAQKLLCGRRCRRGVKDLESLRPVAGKPVGTRLDLALKPAQDLTPVSVKIGGGGADGWVAKA